ncbi:DUF1116 domain-containing protein [Desulfobacterota bacterium AH_259_B03_O07]|nr:DUF1116 domain-containing protein [Desulfobacterota bacterium AH_259_B03_O07]
MASRLRLKKQKGPKGYLAERINRANSVAIGRLFSVEPTFVDVETAINVIPGITKHTILHSGTPIEWERMCDPMKRAVRGALIFEGLANDDKEAENLLRKNSIKLSPNHNHDSVGPMTGIISPSMPVVVTKDLTYRKKVFSTFNEGGGRVLWFGSFGKETLSRLKWIREVFGPIMKKVVAKAGGISIWTILAQGIQMGDECHNRHASSTNIFLKSIIEPLFSLGLSRDISLQVYRFIAGNSHFFLNLTMTSCKLALDAAHDVKDSTLVTAMSRNGTDFGIRVSGIGNRWFMAPAPYLEDALYNPGYDFNDGAPDIGDSSIIETMGLGGFAIAAAPSMAAFAGGGFEDAVRITREMGQITVAKNQKFSIPVMNFEGTPTGIDIRRVVESGVLPSINSAVIHKSSGAGQIGAGIVKAPYECFAKALRAFGSVYRLAA